MEILFLGLYAKEFRRMVPVSLSKELAVDFEQVSGKAYDVLCICEGVELPVRVAAKKSVFIAGEPSVIRSYKNSYLRQFDIAYNTQDYTVVGGGYQFLPWHIGLKRNPEMYDWNFFSAEQEAEKTKCVCAIASNKQYTKGHLDRLAFCKELESEVPDMDLFGRGIHDFEDKIDFLPQYKYHVAIENCSVPDYWTEKLADSFLAGCYTFYYGCTNIQKYFPEPSYTVIDISDPQKSIALIKDAIANNMYEKNVEHIRESRRRVLEEYNLFSVLYGLRLGRRYRKMTILPETEMPDLTLAQRIKRRALATLRGK